MEENKQKAAAAASPATKLLSKSTHAENIHENIRYPEKKCEF